jgi:hypothetical protein
MTKPLAPALLLLSLAVGACGGGRQLVFRMPAADSYALDSHQVNIDGGLTLQGATVTKEFFSTLGLAPLLGRFFTDADFTDAAPQMVILSDQMWERRLNSSPTVIGQSIEIDGRRLTIIGVAPKGLDVPPGTQFWISKK